MKTRFWLLLFYGLSTIGSYAQMTVRGSLGQFAPSAVFDFMTGSIPASFTYTRAGTASRFNANGQLEVVGANTPRFDYDPTTYVNQNLLAPSEDFSGGIWSRVGTTVSTTAVAAPISGTVTKLTESTATSAHTLIGSNTNTAICTFSIHAKAAGRNFLWMYFGGYSGGSTWFDLSTGTAANVEGNVTASIVNLGDGWYRCSITKKNAVNHSSVAANLANSSSSTSYTGDGVSGILLTGAQIETGTVVGRYTKTTSLPVATTTLATLKGLLFEQSRTNLLPYSDDFTQSIWGTGVGVTKTAGVWGSPASTSTVTRVTESAANELHRAFEYIIPSAGFNTYYTMSVYVKAVGNRTRCYLYSIGLGNTTGASAVYDLSTGTVVTGSGTITPIRDGWYRIVNTLLTGAPSTSPGWRLELYNGSGTYAGDGTSGILIWGAQNEVGSFVTSLIPTTGTPVTRNTDFLRTTSVGWVNRQQGTFTGEIWTPNNPTSNKGIFSLNNGGGSMRVDTRYPFTFFVNNSSFANGSGVNNTVQRFAGTYRANYMAFSATGATATTSTSNSIPSGLTQLQIGTIDGGASNALNGHVRKLTYYPNVVSPTYLRRLTQ